MYLILYNYIISYIKTITMLKRITTILILKVVLNILVVVVSGIAGAAIVLSVIAVVCGVVYINKYR